MADLMSLVAEEGHPASASPARLGDNDPEAVDETDTSDTELSDQ